MSAEVSVSGESGLRIAKRDLPASELLEFLNVSPAGPAYSTITERFRTARLQDFLRSMADRLVAFAENDPQPRRFDPDDFARRVVAAEHELLGGADDLKVEYLQRYLIACVREDKVDATWKDLFLRYLRLCTGCHLCVLSHFHEVQGRLSAHERFELPLPNDNVPLTSKKLLPRLPTGFDIELFSAVMADLDAFGLTRIWGGRRTAEIGWSITDNGNRFCTFVTDGPT